MVSSVQQSAEVSASHGGEGCDLRITVSWGVSISRSVVSSHPHSSQLECQHLTVG